MRTLLAVLLLVTTGCRAGDLKPSPIEKDDMCAVCRMAISQPRYAAQVVDKEGNSFRFDDIGCMLRFIRERKMQRSGAAFYAMNYADGRQWLEANKAFYVQSSTVRTPMVSGLAAFPDRPKAEAFATEHKGQVLTFEQLLSGNFGSPQHARGGVIAVCEVG